MKPKNMSVTSKWHPNWQFMESARLAFWFVELKCIDVDILVNSCSFQTYIDVSETIYFKWLSLIYLQFSLCLFIAPNCWDFNLVNFNLLIYQAKNHFVLKLKVAASIFNEPSSSQLCKHQKTLTKQWALFRLKEMRWSWQTCIPMFIPLHFKGS